LKQELAAFFPKEWHSAHRTLEDLGGVDVSNGGQFFDLWPGDELNAKDAPQIAGRGIYVEAAIDYNPSVDANSSLISQGDDKDGWVLHLIAGCPTLTFFIAGQRSTVSIDPLKSGYAMIRVLVPGNGTVSLATAEQCEIIDEAPFHGGFPTQPKVGLQTTESFGPLKTRDYPNSTPFDGPVHRLTVMTIQ
jgi:hypothetical protein